MNTLSSPLLPHGGYRKLRSYKVAEAVYDATVVFCRRFYAQDRRMSDQMVQAARSGVRNISEGSGAAATSRKSEMKLTNVARASLSDELLRDYESFLVQNGLRVWPKDSREALAMRSRQTKDYAPDLPPAPAGRVRLRGASRAVGVCGTGCAGAGRQRDGVCREPSRLPAEAPARKPGPDVCGERRVYREIVWRAESGEKVRQV